MFTGIIKELGTVEAIERSNNGVRLSIAASFAEELSEGASIAVNGVCLTATAIRDEGFDADVMNQSLDLTGLGSLEPGHRVNLEPALRAGDPLGGHIVQGHVDCAGEVAAARSDGFATRIDVLVPARYRRYLVEHGSVTIDGVSLTVATLTDDGFETSLIPETLERTTLGVIEPGRQVNLEVDVIAKYVEKMVGAHA